MTIQVHTIGISPMTTLCTICRWQRIEEPWKLLPELHGRRTASNQIGVVEALEKNIEISQCSFLSALIQSYVAWLMHRLSDYIDPTKTVGDHKVLKTME